MRADVIIVGLGAVGSATLRALARRGFRALGIDRFQPPHDRGSSHGESRIMREAIGEGADYVPLARRSLQLWRELETEGGEELFLPTGVLVIGAADSGSRPPRPRRPGRGGLAPFGGKPRFLGRTLAAARRFAIPHEVLSPGEARRRHPALRIADGEVVYFEPGAGVLRPERCVAAQLAAAGRDGAALVTGERVRAIETQGGGVAVVTEAGRHHAGLAVVCAGAWTAAVAPRGFPAQLAVQRQTQHWFVAEDPALYVPRCLPAFIWLHGAGEGDWFYGFPELAPGGGVKVARERFGRASDPAAAGEAGAEADDAAALRRDQVGQRLAALSERRLRSLSCLYTMAPDSRFVVAETAPGVIAASTCSGHGFKHSPALGEALAAWAVEATVPGILAPFLGASPARAL